MTLILSGSYFLLYRCELGLRQRMLLKTAGVKGGGCFCVQDFAEHRSALAFRLLSPSSLGRTSAMTSLHKCGWLPPSSHLACSRVTKPLVPSGSGLTGFLPSLALILGLEDDWPQPYRGMGKLLPLPGKNLDSQGSCGRSVCPVLSGLGKQDATGERVAPLPPRALSLRHPGWLAGLGGAARPWVRLLEETEAAQGWAGSLRQLLQLPWCRDWLPAAAR